MKRCYVGILVVAFVATGGRRGFHLPAETWL